MDDASSSQPAQTLAYAPIASPVYVPGRRSFFQYRELGVTEATHGRMRAQITKASQGLSEPTGWHYHVCEQQFVYMMKGWVDLEFEDGTKVHMVEGDSLMIPGGMRHNETATSNEMELLEISVPAKFGTVPCDPPAGRS